MSFTIHQDFHTLAIRRTKFPFSYFSILPTHIDFNVSSGLQSARRAFLPGISWSRKKLDYILMRLDKHFEHGCGYPIIPVDLQRNTMTSKKIVEHVMGNQSFYHIVRQITIVKTCPQEASPTPCPRTTAIACCLSERQGLAGSFGPLGRLPQAYDFSREDCKQMGCMAMVGLR